jgi:hypothetical protein
LDTVREYLFRTASQVMLNYRGSPLSRGRAGRVQGGDRLPWAPVDGTDNFSTLAGLDWQIHVYGSATAELMAWCAGHDIQLHVFGWRSEYGVAGLSRDAIYLLRPDTYVALADAGGRVDSLVRYFGDLGMRIAPRQRN